MSQVSIFCPRIQASQLGVESCTTMTLSHVSTKNGFKISIYIKYEILLGDPIDCSAYRRNGNMTTGIQTIFPYQDDLERNTTSYCD